MARGGHFSRALAGLIVTALMLFWVVALAFTARMDRRSEGPPDPLQPPQPLHPAELDGSTPLPELEAL